MQDQRHGSGEAPQEHAKLIVIALMLAVSLAALDTSIIATALPTIVGNLGGLEMFSWVFSIYLLTSTVTVPIYGKLADLYGRKRILLIGIVVFIIGSVLCGTAQDMVMLIIFRAIQGIGAGAVMPVSMTILGDTFSIRERTKVQALFSGVWGVAAIAGPLVGGVLTDSVGWRWIFYVNLPFGLGALVMLWRFYREPAREPRRVVLDYAGAILFVSSIVGLLLVLLQTSHSYGWLSWQSIGLAAFSLALLALFIKQEQRAPEPLVPLDLFKKRTISISCLTVFVAGGVTYGLNSYLPFFEQGVFGGSALEAGLVVGPMSVFWTIGSIICGRAIMRVGFFPTAFTGGVLMCIGSIGMLLQTADRSIWVGVIASSIAGFGMGFVINSTVIAVQNSVDWAERGVATAMAQFSRTIGASFSVALMGSVLTSRMATHLSSASGVPANVSPEDLLDAEERAALDPTVLDTLQHALAASIHDVFFIVAAFGVLCLVVVWFFPRGHVEALAANRSVSQRVGGSIRP